MKQHQKGKGKMVNGRKSIFYLPSKKSAPLPLCKCKFIHKRKAKCDTCKKSICRPCADNFGFCDSCADEMRADYEKSQEEKYYNASQW